MSTLEFWRPLLLIIAMAVIGIPLAMWLDHLRNERRRIGRNRHMLKIWGDWK